MAQLSLRLLGGFLLRADARPRAVPVRKAQALLAYLALRAGRAHARDSLTALLWADTPDKQARQNLRQTMVRLRRAFDGSRRPALVAQGDTVTLNPGAVDVDVAQFERFVRRGTPGRCASTRHASPSSKRSSASSPSPRRSVSTSRCCSARRRRRAAARRRHRGPRGPPPTPH